MSAEGVGAGLRVAVVGAGPSGFYATDMLLKAGFAVDLLDALPTPFGLVRAGVAPDHPKIKSVTRIYERTAGHDAFRFFGGVVLGEDVTAAELEDRYHAVLYAVGTATDTKLGIPGEDLPGSHPATEFVAWYNGHPEHTDTTFDLTVGAVVVVGNGNVAVDCARMLVLDPDELAPTDTADHAVTGFGDSGVAHVTLLGRRGPVQAAFTTPELRELGELARADVVVHEADLELDPDSAAHLEGDAHKTTKDNVALLREFASRERSERSHAVELRFFRSPLEIVAGDDGRVAGVRVAITELRTGEDGRQRAVPTGEEELLPAGLVLRAVGYRGTPIEGVPFDDGRGLIRNAGGRVHEDGEEPTGGRYCVGWIKRGPSGVIGTNKKDAADTVARITEDAEAGRLLRPTVDEDAEAWLAERVRGADADRHLVTWEGWRAIDAHERERGEPAGRPRNKLVRLSDMLEVAAAAEEVGAGRE